jgi:hypothetical protein
MFGANLVGNSVFYGNTTTVNVVATCSQGEFWGLSADLSYDSSITVAVAAAGGSTVSGSGRIVVEMPNGVASGRSVVKLTITRKGLGDGQSASVRLKNVKGVCGSSSNTLGEISKAVKYVKPAPVDPKPQEPETPAEPDPEVNTLSADDLLKIILDTGLTEERRTAARTELMARVNNAEARIKVLESENEELSQSTEPLGVEAEKTGAARIIDNKWAFFGIGAFMATLVAAAIAIIRSLVVSSRSSKAAPTKRSGKRQER